MYFILDFDVTESSIVCIDHVASAWDEGDEIRRTTELIRRWVEESEEFELDHCRDKQRERYDMGHVITPMGVCRPQMDLFIPIRRKEKADG